MGDLKRLAYAYWKLSNWVSNKRFDRIKIAENALNQIEYFLKESGIEVIDLTNMVYDDGLSVEVIESKIDERTANNEVKIVETVKPIIMKDGSIITMGSVRISNEENAGENKETHGSGKVRQENTVKRPSLSVLINTIILIIGVMLLIFMSINFHAISLKINDSNRAYDETVNALKAELTDVRAYNEKILLQLERVSITNSRDLIIRSEYGDLKIIFHIVSKGESLFSICDKNGVSFDKYKDIIKSLNKIENINLIYEGQIILLPLEVERDE